MGQDTHKGLPLLYNNVLHRFVYGRGIPEPHSGNDKGSGCPCIVLAIQDDGHGFDPDVVSHDGSHFGLLGMSERVKLLGGHLSIQSTLGSGTYIVVSIPFKQRGER